MVWDHDQQIQSQYGKGDLQLYVTQCYLMVTQ